jgi:hypothetical protein
MPATDERTLNTTSRPSTNEHAAATSQRAAGAAKGKRWRRSSGEHDQRVESVAADERAEIAHGVNVLQGLGRRLLPR